MSAFFTTPLSALTTKWRIFHEESAELNPRDEKTDFEELRGYKDAIIYRHGQDTLAVYTTSRLYGKLSRFPGVKLKGGNVLLFPDDLLDTVAKVIRAKHKRQFSPEQRETFIRRAAYARSCKKTVYSGKETAPKSVAITSKQVLG